jgi:hypothetical protein
MMSQAYTHSWDGIEYFQLAIPHAEKDPKVAGVKAGCHGIDMTGDFDNFDRDTLKNVSYRLAKSFKKGRVGVFIYYFGPDLVVDLSDRRQLNAEYLERRDDNPMFGPRSGPDWQTRGGFVELHSFPKGPGGLWMISGLYNKVASDDELARWESVSLTSNRLLARNVRAVVDVGR